MVCSTSTRVSCFSRVIDGRKLAGRALVEVGEIRTVLEVEKFVGLDDDRVSRTTLFVAADAPRGREPEHLASDHS